MKKTLLSVMLTACVAFTANAQKLSFGVKGGLTLSKLTDTDHAKTRASIFAGGFANIAFNKNISLQPELLYSAQGVKYEEANLDFAYKMNYINVPVMFQYRFIPEFYLEAGPQLGFLTSAHLVSGKVSVDIRETDARSVEIGTGFGLGYQFPVGLGISARYMFGLVSAFEKANNNSKNSVAHVGVFYTFKHK